MVIWGPKGPRKHFACPNLEKCAHKLASLQHKLLGTLWTTFEVRRTKSVYPAGRGKKTQKLQLDGKNIIVPSPQILPWMTPSQTSHSESEAFLKVWMTLRSIWENPLSLECPHNQPSQGWGTFEAQGKCTSTFTMGHGPSFFSSCRAGIGCKTAERSGSPRCSQAQHKTFIPKVQIMLHISQKEKGW